MKIRIKGDSIRFRLTQSEVKILSEKGTIVDTTNFDKGQFSYGVTLNEAIDHLKASLRDNIVMLEMPESQGRAWYENEIITFDHTEINANGNELYLLLEKDFTCLDNTLENQSDNYPNPKLG